jgi:two-component system cell cycle response regulator
VARILVIEDSAVQLELLSHLLEALGHTVRTAADGARGLGIAGREPMDLILCDLHLPSIDGFEIARRLKVDPVLAQTPLIAVTAPARAGGRDHVLAAGFDGYLGKPILPEKLVSTIDGALEASPIATTREVA